jgi:hypothetical protein
MGPLLRTVEKMVVDIKNFVVLMFFVLCGFMLSFQVTGWVTATVVVLSYWLFTCVRSP